MENKPTKSDDQIAYLSLVQGVINRMASSSVTCKGFSATVFAGVLAVAIAAGISSRPVILLVALFVIVLFATFDCYYFYLEKQYRLLYANVLKGEHEVDFEMSPPTYEVVTVLSTLKSPAILWFYTPLIFILLFSAVLVLLGFI